MFRYFRDLKTDDAEEGKVHRVLDENASAYLEKTDNFVEVGFAEYKDGEMAPEWEVNSEEGFIVDPVNGKLDLMTGEPIEETLSTSEEVPE